LRDFVDVSPEFLHFGFVVDDIDSTYDELTATGINFIMEPSVFGDLKIVFEAVQLYLLEIST